MKKLADAQNAAGEVNHKDGNITVAAKDLPWNVRIVIIPISKTDPRWPKFAGKLNNKDLYALYDIKLIDTLTGKEYELPVGKTVTITISNLTVGGKNSVIAHQKADGSIEYITATIKGSESTVSFKASKFSLYGVAADAKSKQEKEKLALILPNTGDSSTMAQWLLLACMPLALLGSMVISDQKRKRLQSRS